MNSLKSAAVAVVFSAFSCAGMFPTVVPEVTSTEFVPMGEIIFMNRGASFDTIRVRSPRMNLAKRTDGSWGGTMMESGNSRPIDVSVDEKAARGANFVVSREESTATKLVYTGQFEGRIFRFEFDANQALIRATGVNVTLPGRNPQAGVTYYGGEGGQLSLKGLAGVDSPPWPQFAFALFGAFN